MLPPLDVFLELCLPFGKVNPRLLDLSGLFLQLVDSGQQRSRLWLPPQMSLLYGVSAHDPLTLVVVSLVLIAIATIAGSIPARRAMRLDPIVVLREE
jgi:ABC-type antimicrobial peptide transport system permease subunit